MTRCSASHFLAAPEARWLAVWPCSSPVALCSDCSFVVFLAGGHVVPLPREWKSVPRPGAGTEVTAVPSTDRRAGEGVVT